jgi:glycerate 2-kinase
MRVLVAPDKFRGTLTASQAAHAIAAGWLRARPGDDLDIAPIADGGEGTMRTLVDALGGEVVRAGAHDPLGAPVEAEFGLVETAAGRVAVVESAAASGLGLVPEARRNVRGASSRGTGELILEALDRGPRRLVVCLGGTATNDGGVGMASALGVRFLGAGGAEIGPGGAALVDLVTIDGSRLDRRLESVACLAATDVDNPLTGPAGASTVYGPQKGASAADVLLLDRALGHFAAVVARDLGVDLRDTPGAGAAGGLGFGAMAFLGAHVRSGVEVVAEALDLEARISAAELAITGEGRFDAQSLRGKAAAGVLRLARELGVPSLVVCGEADPNAAASAGRVVSLVDRFGARSAIDDARRSLEALAEELAGRGDELAEGP